MSAPRAATINDVPRLAQLHTTVIHEGFLGTLGPAFLQRLYGRVVRSARAFALVVDGDGDRDGGAAAPCGFIAVAEDIGAFYREFVIHDGLVAGLVAVPRIVRAPRHVWETLRYGARSGNDAPRTEILAVAVDGDARRRGIGGVLARAAVDELRRRGVTSARVVTATGNVAAMRTYELAGFRRAGTDAVHRGVVQEVLVWP